MTEHISEGFPGQRIRVLPRPLVLAASQQGPTSSLLVTDVGFFPQAQHHWRMRRSADQAIVILCAAGRGRCQIAGRTHHVNAGEVLVIPAGASHQYQADEDRPWTIWWAHFMGKDVPTLVAAALDGYDAPVLAVDEPARIAGLFDSILRRMETDESPRTLQAATGAGWHLLSLLAADRRPRGRTHGDPIAEVREYLAANLTQHPSVDDLAAMAGFSVSHFNALFRRKTGYGPLEYQTRLRMSAARQLLDTTDLSIAAVARQVGYPDPMYFSRQFRRIHETPPSVYRQRGAEPQRTTGPEVL